MIKNKWVITVLVVLLVILGFLISKGASAYYELKQSQKSTEYIDHVEEALDTFLGCTQHYEDKLYEYASNPNIAENTQWIEEMKQHEACMLITIVGITDYEDVPAKMEVFHRELSSVMFAFGEVIPTSTVMLEYDEVKFGKIMEDYEYSVSELSEFVKKMSDL